MQNKPNLLESQMNLTFYLKRAYENRSDWILGENKPKQSQFQTQRRPFCLFHKRLPLACSKILVKIGKDLLEYVLR